MPVEATRTYFWVLAVDGRGKLVNFPLLVHQLRGVPPIANIKSIVDPFLHSETKATVLLTLFVEATLCLLTLLVQQYFDTSSNKEI